MNKVAIKNDIRMFVNRLYNLVNSGKNEYRKEFLRSGYSFKYYALDKIQENAMLQADQVSENWIEKVLENY